MPQDRVGIIGPGRMGLAMLKHLKKHRFEVTAYDPFTEAHERAEELHLNPLEILPIGRRPAG